MENIMLHITEKKIIVYYWFLVKDDDIAIAAKIVNNLQLFYIELNLWAILRTQNGIQ